MKRLFRKWLKRRLVKIAIEKRSSIPTYAFEWIYNSPMHTWRDKLLIVRAFGDLDFYEERYRWLNSDNTCDTDKSVTTSSPDTK